LFLHRGLGRRSYWRQLAFEDREQINHRLLDTVVVNKVRDPFFHITSKLRMGSDGFLASEDLHFPVCTRLEKNDEHGLPVGEVPGVEQSVGVAIDLRVRGLPASEDVDLNLKLIFNPFD